MAAIRATRAAIYQLGRLTTRQYSSPAAAAEVTLTDVAGTPGLKLLSLNRPVAKNAVGAEMLRLLRSAIDELKSDKLARVVVLRSQVDGVFCAGADLKERRAMSPSQAHDFVTSLRSTFTALATLPMPTVRT